LPPDSDKVALLYKRIGSRDLKQAVMDDVGQLVAKSVAKLSPKEREALRTVRLEWDIPIDSVFYGTGLQFHNEARTLVVYVSVQRFVVPAPPQPQQPTLPSEIKVKVSQI